MALLCMRGLRLDVRLKCREYTYYYVKSKTILMATVGTFGEAEM